MNKKRDYSQLLIMSAMVVTIARYIGAFVASDVGEITGVASEGISMLMGITGLGMGILDVLGSAYIFDGWRTKMPSNGNKWSFRFKVLTLFVFSLFVVGLGILVPFTVSRVMHMTVGDVLGQNGVWLWSLAVNVAPYILIGGVVSSQSGVINVKSEMAMPKVPMAQDGTEISTKKTYQEFCVMQAARNGNGPMSAKDVITLCGVPKRTAYNWLNKYEKENVKE